MQPKAYLEGFLGKRDTLSDDAKVDFDRNAALWKVNVQETIFQKRITACNADVSVDNDNAQEKTWSLQVGKETVMTSCFKRVYMANEPTATYKVRALYLKHTICGTVPGAADAMAGKSCTTKNVLYECKACKTSTRTLRTDGSIIEKYLDFLDNAALNTGDFALKDCASGSTGALVECSAQHKVTAAIKN